MSEALPLPGRAPSGLRPGAEALRLPAPGETWQEAERWVDEHLDDLCGDDARASLGFRGGERAAQDALHAFDVGGYASRRNQVWPRSARGASYLSPYIRHGLLSLPRVWDHVAGGPARDVKKFRDELLWQEYARHLYARLGSKLGESLRASQLHVRDLGETEPWTREMLCLSRVMDDLGSQEIEGLPGVPYRAGHIAESLGMKGTGSGYRRW